MGQSNRDLIVRQFVGLLVALSFTLPTAANQLQLELTRVAKTVKQIADAEGVDSVSIGRFSGPPTVPSDANAGLNMVFRQELERTGLKITRRASIGIKGEYFIEPDLNDSDHAHEPLAVRIDIQLVDAFGKVLTKLDFRSDTSKEELNQPAGFQQGKTVARVTDANDIVALLGANVALPPDLDLKSRQEVFKKALLNPTCFLSGSQVMLDERSPYALEILVKRGEEYQPLKPTLEEGLPFVNLKKGDVYAIKLVNRSQHDSAVRISIDGLNSFAFADNSDFRFLIVPSGQEPLIKGWYRTSTKVDTFLVGSIANSAAAELNADTSGVGTITANFAAAWEENAQPPADELSAKLLANRGEKLATGRGPAAEQNSKLVLRHIGVPREAISIRYSLD